MKKITTALSILTLCAILGVSNPLVAQSNVTPATTDNTSMDTHDNDDDSGKWGFVGLLGLLGLLGLRKRDVDVHRNTTVTR